MKHLANRLTDVIIFKFKGGEGPPGKILNRRRSSWTKKTTTMDLLDLEEDAHRRAMSTPPPAKSRRISKYVGGTQLAKDRKKSYEL